MNRHAVAGMTLAWVLLAGCGSELAPKSQLTDGGRESAPGASEGSAPALDGGDGAMAATAPCPAAMPAAGAACAIDQLACEYGTDPALECDAIVTCTGGAWTITQTPFTGGTFCSTTVTNLSCPASVADVMQGATCGSSFFECYFPEARCECRCTGPGNGVQCVPANAAMTWQCDSSSTAGCPAVRPRLGAACSTDNTTCTYAGADGGACWGDEIACRGGVWINVGGSGC